MKWIIYILLLINLGFGLLHFRSTVLVTDKAPLDEENLRLVLLKEYLEGDPVKETHDTLIEVSSNSTARCNTIGPFKSKKLANTLRKKLKKLGIPTKRRTSKDKRKGIWVLIPPADSRKIARQSVAKLKKNNVDDYFLVVSGEQTNAVSLGVFSQSNLAQRRYDEMLALGFKIEIRQVDLPKREYWLDWPKDRPLSPSILDKFRLQFPNIGHADRTC